MMILNLTQHVATPDQIDAGVFEPINKKEVQDLLTFDRIPSLREMDDRALALAKLARDHGVYSAMVGGAPYFMSPLERALLAHNIDPLYSFSVREAVEEPQPDGSVKKSLIFRHAGFVGENV